MEYYSLSLKKKSVLWELSFQQWNEVQFFSSCRSGNKFYRISDAAAVTYSKEADIGKAQMFHYRLAKIHPAVPNGNDAAQPATEDISDEDDNIPELDRHQRALEYFDQQRQNGEAISSEFLMGNGINFNFKC